MIVDGGLYVSSYTEKVPEQIVEYYWIERDARGCDQF